MNSDTGSTHESDHDKFRVSSFANTIKTNVHCDAKDSVASDLNCFPGATTRWGDHVRNVKSAEQIKSAETGHDCMTIDDSRYDRQLTR